MENVTLEKTRVEDYFWEVVVKCKWERTVILWRIIRLEEGFIRTRKTDSKETTKMWGGSLLHWWPPGTVSPNIHVLVSPWIWDGQVNNRMWCSWKGFQVKALRRANSVCFCTLEKPGTIQELWTWHHPAVGETQAIHMEMPHGVRDVQPASSQKL